MVGTTALVSVPATCVFGANSVWKWAFSTWQQSCVDSKLTLNTTNILSRSNLQVAIAPLVALEGKERENTPRVPCLTTCCWIALTVLQSHPRATVSVSF